MKMIQSTYQIDAAAAIGKVVLKVANIEKMSQFYSDVISTDFIGAKCRSRAIRRGSASAFSSREGE